MAVQVTYSAQTATELGLQAMRILAESERVMDGEYYVLPRARSLALRHTLELLLQSLGTPAGFTRFEITAKGRAALDDDA